MKTRRVFSNGDPRDTVTVSGPQIVFERAKKRAAKKRLSFSAYVVLLLEDARRNNRVLLRADL